MPYLCLTFVPKSLYIHTHTQTHTHTHTHTHTSDNYPKIDIPHAANGTDHPEKKPPCADRWGSAADRAALAQFEAHSRISKSMAVRANQSEADKSRWEGTKMGESTGPTIDGLQACRLPHLPSFPSHSVALSGTQWHAISSSRACNFTTSG
jgi:hypothetical protein